MAEPTIRHLLVDARCCQNLLDDPDALLAVMRSAAARVGATEVGEAAARYVPHGVSAVLFLAESHILLSTWPEHGLVLADIQFCNSDMNPADAWAVMGRELRPSETRWTWIRRGKAIDSGEDFAPRWGAGPLPERGDGGVELP